MSKSISLFFICLVILFSSISTIKTRYRFFGSGKGWYITRREGGNTQRYTNWNNSGNGNIFYLDRHHVDCQHHLLIDFQLERSGNNIRYRYNCSHERSHNLHLYYTSWNNVARNQRKSVHYLDRHDVKCPADRGLSGFVLQRHGNQIRYAYSCVLPPVAQKCDFHGLMHKEENLDGKSIFYLDRFYVHGRSNNYLSGFKLSRKTKHGFEVRCVSGIGSLCFERSNFPTPMTYDVWAYTTYFCSNAEFK